MTYHHVLLADGRQLEVLEEGSGERCFVYLSGTPGAAIPDPEFARLAQDHGLRILRPMRPGYGQSDPLPGRQIAHLVGDLEAVLLHLGIDETVVMGGSGGGPHTLAMAARLPQCRAASVLVSPAPRDADGLDFYDGMALSNQEEWHLADQGEGHLRPWLEKVAAELVADQEQFLAQFGDAFSAEDSAAYAESTDALGAARFAKAVERGIEGWLQDDLAMTTPWGFDVAEITKPVTFWAGRADQFLSYRHTTWLAERVPHADVHLFGEEGHVSLRLHHMDAMVRDLLRKAGW